MARKPRDAARGKKKLQRTFDERAFVDGVYNDEFFLVVGSGVVLNPLKFPSSEGDINKYIIEEVNNDFRDNRKDFVEYRSFTDIFRGTALDEIDPIYKLLTDDYYYDLSDISMELTQVLRTRLFKFVITTTIDNYIETLMRDIWGDKLRIVNIWDNQSMKDFRGALALSSSKSRVNRYNQPTLFYAFGKVINGRPKPRGFVETDVDAIKVIETWIKIDKSLIVPFMKEKRILALGCKYDDWFFRFFWYILTRGFNDSDRGGYKDLDGNLLTNDNLAAMFDPNSQSDQQLKDYLHRRGVFMHDNVWEFMRYIYTLLSSTAKDSLLRRFVLEKRRQGGIFISYKSCDVLIASELFHKLAREKDLNVWYDNISLKGGDEYVNEIHKAISQALIFIPILSPSIAEDLKIYGENINEFYSREWRWAAENKDLVIMPLYIDGYDFRKPENKLFEKIIKHKSTGIDFSFKPLSPFISERNGYAKLLESIISHLGLSEE